MTYIYFSAVFFYQIKNISLKYLNLNKFHCRIFCYTKKKRFIELNIIFAPFLLYASYILAWDFTRGLLVGFYMTEIQYHSHSRIRKLRTSTRSDNHTGSWRNDSHTDVNDFKKCDIQYFYGYCNFLR